MVLAVQILLSAVIVSLTVLVSIIGIQIFQILHDFRLTLKKVNRILDNTQSLSELTPKHMTNIDQLISNVSNIDSEDISEQIPDEIIPSAGSGRIQFHKRFFHRSGLPLRAS